MKKFIFSLLFILLFSANVFAAGTCPYVVSDVWQRPAANISMNMVARILTFTCTGDVSAGTFPNTSLTAADAISLAGFNLLVGSTVNGTPAPTNGYNIFLYENGVDLLGGAGATRPGTAAVSSQFVPRIDTVGYVSGPNPLIGSNLTLSVTGSTVASGVTTITFKFVK